MSQYGSPGFLIGGAAQGAMSVPPMQLPTVIRRAAEGAFWSTWDFGVAAAAIAGTTFSYFSTPVGSTGQGFPRALAFPETNIKEQGRIPNGLAYACRALAFQPYACIPAASGALNYPVPLPDILNLQHQCAIQWNLYGSYIDVSPISLIGAGGGVFGSTADTGGGYGTTIGSQVALNNGAGQVWVYQVQAVLLPGGQTFSLDLIPGPDAATVNLDGVSNLRLRGRLVMLGNYQQAVATG